VRPAEVVRRGAEYLARHEVESPRPTAEVLLAAVLGTDRAGLYSRTGGLTTQEARSFRRALSRRCAGTPLQHLTGEQGFRRLTIAVRPGVFVPRPETEVLVEAGLDLVSKIPGPIVVDVGTGAGAIALAIKDERRDARVLATDASADAVALAAENAETLGLEIELVEGDLLSGLPADLRGQIHLVVGNPPYVAPTEYESLPADVRADPFYALVGGLELYERLFASARAWLRPAGAVAVEIGEAQGGAVREAARSAGLEDLRVLPDLAARERVVTARRR
jgi:release factor glutamine methyltransferase